MHAQETPWKLRIYWIVSDIEGQKGTSLSIEAIFPSLRIPK